MFDKMKEAELERVREERDFWKHRALKLQARRKKSAAFAYKIMTMSVGEHFMNKLERLMK